MRRVLTYWPHLALASCMAVAAGLAFWPASAKTHVRTAEPAYSGGLFQSRQTSEEPGFPFRSGVIEAASNAAPAPAPAPTLVGVVGGAAYLRSASTNEVERLAVGSTLDGWRVKVIGRRHVIVDGASGDQRLELFTAPAHDATAASQTAPSAPQAPVANSAPGE